MNLKNYLLLFLVFITGGYLSLTAQTFTGDNTGAAVTNAAPVDSQADVTLTGNIGTDFIIDNVTLDIDHVWSGDLVLTLISPAGTSLVLSDGNGGSADNYTNTVFQDGGADITAASAPFTGTFEPEAGTFAATFDGEAVNGLWTLNIEDTFSTDDGVFNSFEITFAPPPSCQQPLNLSVTNITTDSADLNWDDVSNATNGFEWFVFASGDDPLTATPVATGTVGAGVTTASLTGVLTPETPYDFYVNADCDTDGVSDLSGPESFFTPIANDDCTGALPLTITTDNTTFTTFSTDFASEGADELTDCDASGNLGVWYSFTAPAATLQFLQGASGDPGISIFEGPDCSSLTELTATCINNDSGTITGLTPGNDYFAMVWTDSAQSTAEFVLFFETCPSPTNLSVTNITSDSADLNWDDVTEATNGYEWFVFASGDDPLTATPIATATVGAGVSTANVTGLTGGLTYDFYVNANCDTDGISNLSGPESFSTPFENDECSGALPATVTAFGDTSQPINFDTTGAEDAILAPSCEGFDSGESDLWFTFTTNDADSVVLSLLSGTAGDLEGAVYDACGGTELFCFADGSSVDFSSDVTVPGLTPNTTYFLQVYTESFSEGAFSLAITDPPPPANDDLCDAVALTVGAPSSGDAYTNVSATAQTDEPVASCFNDGINGSVWFTFDAPASGEVTVTTDIPGATLTDTEVAVYDAPTDCSDLTTLGSELGCNQDIGFPNFQSEVNLTGLTAGDTYYIQVDQWGSATPGTFGIRVLDANPPCPEPSNLNVTNITTDSADLNWDDVTEATSGFEWFVFASGDDPLTATPVATATVGAGVITDNVTGLSPETPYDFYVSSDCDANGTSVLSGPVSFTTSALPPANDNLCDAIALTVDATSTGDAYTNVGATAQTDEPVASCFNGGINGSVWFTFDAPASGSVEVTTDIAGATLTDTEVAVYEAPTDCSDLTTLGTELGCNQDISFSNFQSQVNLTGLTAGDTYYIQVDQWGTTTPGTFGIEVRESLASVQVIHNSADPAAEFVDVYLDGTLLLDDFEFRTATQFVDVPAGAPIDIDIAPGTSTDVSDSVFNLNTTLTADETYVVVANGVLDPAQFDSSVNTIAFNLDVFAGAQQASTNAGETSVLVHHGSTDAPTVDVAETLVGAGIIVDDISYTEFQGYLDLDNLDYEINVESSDNTAVVAAYEAPLQTLGLVDEAITVLASGFLDPANNQSGPAFGLWVALPAGGDLVPLPEKSIGTETFNDQNFSFYPNPAENRLNLQTTGQVQEVKVYNMLGQQVMRETPNTVSPSLNVEALQVGSYIMNVTIDGSSENFRFIKE